MQDNTVAVDFETSYTKERSITTIGLHAYVTHPDTIIYMVSMYGYVNGELLEYAGPVEDAPWGRINGCTWLAHNCGFDSFVFSQAVFRKQISDQVYPTVWYDTSDLSVFLGGGRSLKDAARDHLGIQISKDVRDSMKGADWRVLQTDAEVIKYALSDAKNCYDLWDKLGDKWPEAERRLSNLNIVMGWTGIQVDLPKVDDGIAKLERVIFDSRCQLPWAERGAAPLSKKALDLTCREAGIEPPASLAEDNPACIKWEEKYSAKFPWVKAMRDMRKANTFCKKLRVLRERTRPNGRVMTPLKYFGASTGRFSGTAGINFQNLNREPIYGVDMRSCLIGDLYVVDFSAIEPRCMYAILEDEPMLELVRKGMDVYEAYARMYYGYNDPRPLKEVDKHLRNLCKACVLALGYGVGANKLQATSELLYGVTFTGEEAYRVVREFRDKNKHILSKWSALDTGLRLAVQGNGSLEIPLPSGRSLWYYDVHVEKGQIQCKTNRSDRHYSTVYGSKIYENCIQSLARDVLRDAMIRVSDAGYNLVLSVHDELVIDGVTTDEQAKDIDRIMCQVPEWLPNLPLAVEGSRMQVYQK